MAKPETVKIGGPEGKELFCLVCGHHEFLTRSALLITAVMSFFGFDWANQSADCHVCDQCGHVHWFLPRR